MKTVVKKKIRKKMGVFQRDQVVKNKVKAREEKRVL